MENILAIDITDTFHNLDYFNFLKRNVYPQLKPKPLLKPKIIKPFKAVAYGISVEEEKVELWFKAMDATNDVMFTLPFPKETIDSMYNLFVERVMPLEKMDFYLALRTTLLAVWTEREPTARLYFNLDMVQKEVRKTLKIH